MRQSVLIILLFASLTLSARDGAASQAAPQQQGTLISSIVIEGFVLQDKEQFTKLFKPYRNKHLTTADMDAILDQIQVIYEREGYQQLVSITYHVNKHRLIFTALMTS
jgi:hemolysin activation/secretion protein